MSEVKLSKLTLMLANLTLGGLAKSLHLGFTLNVRSVSHLYIIKMVLM